MFYRNMVMIMLKNEKKFHDVIIHYSIDIVIYVIEDTNHKHLNVILANGKQVTLLYF